MSQPIDRQRMMSHLTQAMFIAIVSNDDDEVQKASQELSLRIASLLSKKDVKQCKIRTMERVRDFQREHCVRRQEPLPP
jgi:hypothetical protein